MRRNKNTVELKTFTVGYRYNNYGCVSGLVFFNILKTGGHVNYTNKPVAASERTQSFSDRRKNR